MGARVKKLNGRAEKKKAGQQQKPREKIEAAFYKLNPTHVIHPSKLGLIIVIGGILRGALPADDRAASGAEKNLRIIGSAMPRSPGCSLNTASKEIANLQAVAKKLKKALSTMHAPTIFSMLHAGVHIEKFEETLNVIIGDIDKTKEALEQLKKKEASGQLKKDYPEWASKKLGRPKKEGALHIAEILADEYCRATGKMPTLSNRLIDPNKDEYKKYGKFLDLVQSVFDALEIKARPEDIARRAINLLKQRKAIVDAKYKSASDVKERSL